MYAYRGKRKGGGVLGRMRRRRGKWVGAVHRVYVVVIESRQCFVIVCSLELGFKNNAYLALNETFLYPFYHIVVRFYEVCSWSDTQELLILQASRTCTHDVMQSLRAAMIL